MLGLVNLDNVEIAVDYKRPDCLNTNLNVANILKILISAANLVTWIALWY
jgi:hypothetical protein